jgi:CheY-like chemotaxis protein
MHQGTTWNNGHGSANKAVARYAPVARATRRIGSAEPSSDVASDNDPMASAMPSAAATLVVRLALRQSEAPSPALVQPAEPEAAMTQAQHSDDQPVILVVDDDDAIRRLTQRTLASRGYRVLEAQGGEAALAVSRQCEGRIDLLLTDIIMPGMHGADVARHVTADRPDTPVLFMSGHAEDILGARGIITDDATRLLPKPFGGRELVHAVEGALAGECDTAS